MKTVHLWQTWCQEETIQINQTVYITRSVMFDSIEAEGPGEVVGKEA